MFNLIKENIGSDHPEFNHEKDPNFTQVIVKDENLDLKIAHLTGPCAKIEANKFIEEYNNSLRSIS